MFFALRSSSAFGLFYSNCTCLSELEFGVNW